MGDATRKRSLPPALPRPSAPSQIIPALSAPHVLSLRFIAIGVVLAALLVAFAILLAALAILLVAPTMKLVRCAPRLARLCIR